MKTRTGKIARLPKAVREQLNQRLADGEQGETLLQWLHSLPEVIEVLVRDFDARPILKQNLSEWRQGGFRDWEARQERLEQVRLLAEEADDTQAAAPALPDHLAAIVAARFATVITATTQVKDWSKPRHRAQLMEMNEAVATLRRFNQGAARLQLEREQLEIKKAELQLAQEAQKKRTHEQWREWAKAYQGRLVQECKTPGELLAATSRLIFGEEPYDEGTQQNDVNSNRPAPSEQHQQLAASIISQRDQIEVDKSEIKAREAQLKMKEVEVNDAIQEALKEIIPNRRTGSDKKNQPPSPQGGQTQSNLIKPNEERLNNEDCVKSPLASV